MKRKDTILSITANISTLAFRPNFFKEDMESLAYQITYYGEGKFDRWYINPVNVVITNTAIENRKNVKFIYTINSARSDSNYENSVGMKMCLNLQKVFNSVNLICNSANQCYIDNFHNSRLNK